MSDIKLKKEQCRKLVEELQARQIKIMRDEAELIEKRAELDGSVKIINERFAAVEDTEKQGKQKLEALVESEARVRMREARITAVERSEGDLTELRSQLDQKEARLNAMDKQLSKEQKQAEERYDEITKLKKEVDDEKQNILNEKHFQD